MPSILILESYGPTRQALATILERAGWEVGLSQTEQETFNTLVRQAYDVLLVDLEMSTREGRCLLQRLAAARVTPIIAILNPDSPCRQPVHELGAGVILYKP